jgi:hypothetical protein
MGGSLWRRLPPPSAPGYPPRARTAGPPGRGWQGGGVAVIPPWLRRPLRLAGVPMGKRRVWEIRPTPTGLADNLLAGSWTRDKGGRGVRSKMILHSSIGRGAGPSQRAGLGWHGLNATMHSPFLLAQSHAPKLPEGVHDWPIITSKLSDPNHRRQALKGRPLRNIPPALPPVGRWSFMRRSWVIIRASA